MTTTALLLWTLGALAGSMLFFAAVVAPLVFRALSAAAAGAFLRAFFPRYYLWGIAVAAAAAALAAFVDWRAFAACAAVALLFVYARQSLMPKINAARDASQDGDAAAAARFERLHRISVLINAAQLLALLAIAAALVG
ncbi:MAG: DUF4149 domain-containing protein [Gammaproteobacteria bacterium]|nr:DUF4149 domain-containing protein [Gammaproteobacteria bacterium]